MPRGVPTGSQENLTPEERQALAEEVARRKWEAKVRRTIQQLNLAKDDLSDRGLTKINIFAEELIELIRPDDPEG